MLSDLIIDYSWWTLLPVFLIGIVYSGLLYTGKNAKKLNKGIRIFLAFIRFFVIVLLAFLLLNPSVKTRSKFVEKPRMVIGVDNSTSMVSVLDTVSIVDSINDMIHHMKNGVENNMDVDVIVFGERASLEGQITLTDNFSDYSAFFNIVDKNYSGLNLGPVVVIGDGLFNRGVDPISSASAIHTPLYSIAMGDTVEVPDISVVDVRYNSLVYIDDIFPVEVSVDVSGYRGREVELSLYDGSTLISSEKIKSTDDNFVATKVFDVTAIYPGRKRFVITAQVAKGEKNTSNNSKNIFVDVLNNRQKILIFGYAPHPDIGAIKRSILENNNYSVDIGYSGQFKGDVTDYDLVILHQIPAMHFSAVKQLKQLKEKHIPIMFVIGEGSNLGVFNRYCKSLDIITGVHNYTDAVFEYNNKFVGFTFGDELRNQLSELPPLKVPLGNYKVNANAKVFAYQKINNIITDFPLILYYADIDNEECVIAGEGLWLWEMQSKNRYDNSDAVSEMIQKSVMMLLAGNDNRKFKVFTSGEYYDNENVVIKAELFNDALEPVNNLPVKLKITDRNGLSYDHEFTSANNGYIADIGTLPLGIYSYQAKVETGKEKITETGEFVVNHIDIESNTMVANHGMLNRLSAFSGGKVYYPANYNELITKINDNDNFVSKVHYEYSFTSLLKVMLILVSIVVLLSVEWFTRKYFGSY